MHMYSHPYVTGDPGELTRYVFAVYSPWVMSTGSPPPSDRPVAGAQHVHGGLCVVPDCPDCARELHGLLTAAEQQALMPPEEREPSFAVWLEGAHAYFNVEGLHRKWCGVYGFTKPDEIRLMNHVLAEDREEVLWRSDMLLDTICARWPAVLTKWTEKGWWDYGVSLRTGWITDKGRAGFLRRAIENERKANAMGLEYETELHSTHPDAVQATTNTIKALGGKLVERDGKYFLQGASRPAHFIQWAAVQQGYVRGAKPVDSEGFTEEQRKAEARLMASLREIDEKEGRA